MRELRDTLSKTIASGEVTGSEIASLAGKYMTCLGQIEELEKVSRKGSVVDEIADRRKARRANAKGVVSAKRGRVDSGTGSD